MSEQERGRTLQLRPITFIYLMAATALIPMFWILYPLEDWVLLGVPLMWLTALLHGKYGAWKAHDQ